MAAIADVTSGPLLNACQSGEAIHGQPTAQRKPTSIILIHGAWHGGWCWKYVIAELRKQQPNLPIYAPSLLGLGDRQSALTPELGLKDQIDDIGALIVDNDLQNITLMGHSFGGMIITGLAERFKNKIAKIIYLDAVVPDNGQSMAVSGQKLTHDQKEKREAGLRSLAKDGVAMRALPPEAFGVPKTHSLYDWVAENLTPHPLKTCLDPISLLNGGSVGLNRTYIRCTDPALDQPGILAAAKIAASDKGWQYTELDTGHDAMVTAPAELARILLTK